MSAGSLAIQDAMALFSDHNEAAGKSPKTQRYYQQQLGAFARWMEARGTPTVGETTIPTVELFTVQLRRRTTRYAGHPFAPERDGGLSSYSILASVRALRAFAHWLHDAGYLEEDTLADLKPPKAH